MRLQSRLVALCRKEKPLAPCYGGIAETRYATAEVVGGLACTRADSVVSTESKARRDCFPDFAGTSSALRRLRSLRYSPTLAPRFFASRFKSSNSSLTRAVQHLLHESPVSLGQGLVDSAFTVEARQAPVAVAAVWLA